MYKRQEYTNAKIITNKNKSGILLDLESGNSIMLFINCIPEKMTTSVIQKLQKSTETLSISGKWKINFIEGAPVSVSYTHLDVYKRQVWNTFFLPE